ncbi:MAG: hypothetical protein AAF694_31375 [Bacteroidota bacterium]
MENVTYQTPKLYTVFCSLDREEQKHFQRWLKAELQEKDAYVQDLCEELIRLRGKKFSKEKVWRNLYAKKPYDDSRLRKLMGKLATYLEEFLAIQAFREDTSFQKSLYVLQQYRKRNLTSIFNNYYRKLRRKQDRDKYRDSSFYRKEYELALEKAHFQFKYEHGVSQLPVEQLNLAFDAWWIHQKLEFACTNASSAAILGKPAQIQLLHQAEESLQSHPEYRSMRLFHILWELYRLTHNTPGISIAKIQALLFDSSASLSHQHKKEIFALLSNYLIRKLNQAYTSDIADTVFQLHSWALEENIIFQENKLHWQQYKNLISIGLRIHKVDVAEKWLESLQHQLEPHERIEAYSFNRAQVCLEKKEFSEVISILSNCKFSRVLYEIPARAALIQAHFELYSSQDEWLLTQTENLIRYVQSQNLAETYKKSYLNRFRLFKKFLKASSQRELQKLKAEVGTTQPLSRSEWLLSKIDQRMLTEYPPVQ